MTEKQDPEVCICAAILMLDGYIVRGHRHHDCLRSASDMGRNTRAGMREQGFLTTRGRFVGRAEGLTLQLAAGIESAAPGGYRSQLYSEDLY